MKTFPLFLSLFFILLQPIRAQWSQLSGPGVSGTLCVYEDNGTIYTGTDIDGVFKSTDSGNTWIAANGGLENSKIQFLSSNNSYLFASRVDENNQQMGGIYRSSNGGSTWEPANSGIENELVLSIFADGDNLFIGTVGNSIFKSTDNGDTWFPSSNGLGLQSVSAITKNGSSLFASGDNNLYYSPDEGANWYYTNGGQFFIIFSIGSFGNNMFAGGFQGLVRSTDGGSTWSNVIFLDYLLGFEHLTSFAYDGSTLYASTEGNGAAGVIKSTDQGLTWSLSNDGIENVDVSQLYFSSNKLFASAEGKGIMVSPDGNTWNKSNSGLPHGGIVRKLYNYNNSILAGTGYDGLYQTTDEGITWNKLGAGTSIRNETILSITSKDGFLFAGTSYHGIYRSSDNGNSWEHLTNGLPSTEFVTLQLNVAGNNTLAGTGDAMYWSSDDGDTWITSSLNSATINGLAVAGNFAYAIGLTGFFNSSGIYRSTNNGINWDLIYPSGSSTPASIAAKNNFVYVGDLESGIMTSSDYGNSFPSDALTQYGVYSILPLSDSVYIGTQVMSPESFKSDVYGLTWYQINQGLNSPLSIETLANDNTYIYGGTDEKGIWVRPRYDITPVELTSFTAQQEDNFVELKWSTATETNNKEFIIEKKLSGNWFEAGRCDGNGTTSEAHSYSFKDGTSNQGVSKIYYRIKQVDFNGTYTYSATIQLSLTADKFELAQNYPNPFNPTTNISYRIPKAGKVSLKIYDDLGNEIAILVNEEKPAGSYNTRFDASGLASGIYFYKLQSGNFSAAQKMILMR